MLPLPLKLSPAQGPTWDHSSCTSCTEEAWQRLSLHGREYLLHTELVYKIRSLGSMLPSSGKTYPLEHRVSNIQVVAENLTLIHLAVLDSLELYAIEVPPQSKSSGSTPSSPGVSQPWAGNAIGAIISLGNAFLCKWSAGLGRMCVCYIAKWDVEISRWYACAVCAFWNVSTCLRGMCLQEENCSRVSKIIKYEYDPANLALQRHANASR